jgi:PAS domain S-box-containing protein
MNRYLDFKVARCKDCYKCLRECPVKAIDVKDHQAKIIDDRCILCGHCTTVCPQNAKVVHSELDNVKKILEEGGQIFASVAPSYVASFQLQDFSIFKIALGKLGFTDADETAIGANAVVREYKRHLDSGEFKNYIASACPALCKLIQLYYPKALRYLAPVDSPMIAHAKIIKSQYPDAKIIFIGPCIAKKREASESNLIDAVLTFEELKLLFDEREIVLDEITKLNTGKKGKYANYAKAFPITSGIIKSFHVVPDGYEYMAVDGVTRCMEVLENIDCLSGVFLEMNTCENACVNGPCSLMIPGGSVKATADVKTYVKKDKDTLPIESSQAPLGLDFSTSYPRMRNASKPATEKEIDAILAKTGKVKPEDELNCGACGYATCREKAWAVYNGYADIEVCLPYMRKRAESMSYEVIQNSPEGLIVLDTDFNVIEINNKAKALLGITDQYVKGRPAIDFFDPSEFMEAYNKKQHMEMARLFVKETKKYVDLSINLLTEHNTLFGIMKDVTAQVNYDDKLSNMKMETLMTTDGVIQKQMRVAQEIASLLGETTAETKVALLKLKKTLQQEDNNTQENNNR